MTNIYLNEPQYSLARDLTALAKPYKKSLNLNKLDEDTVLVTSLKAVPFVSQNKEFSLSTESKGLLRTVTNRNSNYLPIQHENELVEFTMKDQTDHVNNLIKYLSAQQQMATFYGFLNESRELDVFMAEFPENIWYARENSYLISDAYNTSFLGKYAEFTMEQVGHTYYLEKK